MLTNHKTIKKSLIDLFIAYNVEKVDAKYVCDLLVKSDLVGQESHGIARAAFYIKKIIDGTINLKPKIKILNNTKTTALIDGDWGLGQIVANYATKQCIRKAAKNNIGCITLRNCNHIGRLSDFTSQAAKKNMIGIAFANLHGISGIVSPHGGIDRKLPTNPISITLPMSANKNFDMDMSSSSISEGKVKLKYLKKLKMKKGYLINKLGNFTTSPKDFYVEPKGSILPLGGIASHKGFALSMAIDILAGALSNAGCTSNINKRHGNALTLIFIKISSFNKLKDFKKNVNSLCNHVKKSRLAKGSREILIPGEYESNILKKRKKNGLKIDENILKQLKILAKPKGVNFKL